mmetsp:Transcript_73802/g.238963  ORF Transcript_73802/g.238963 Transcript_73802/m.238963 type:complete len:268 (-) Transcript_73802:60-863(-)
MLLTTSSRPLCSSRLAVFRSRSCLGLELLATGGSFGSSVVWHSKTSNCCASYCRSSLFGQPRPRYSTPHAGAVRIPSGFDLEAHLAVCWRSRPSAPGHWLQSPAAVAKSRGDVGVRSSGAPQGASSTRHRGCSSSGKPHPAAVARTRAAIGITPPQGSSLVRCRGCSSSSGKPQPAAVAKTTADVGVRNFGAPPRLRLMEKGFSFEQATSIARTIERCSAEGMAYEEAWAKAMEEISANRGVSGAQSDLSDEELPKIRGCPQVLFLY